MEPSIAVMYIIIYFSLSQVDDDDLFDEDYVKSCSLLKAMKDPLVPADCTEPFEVLQCFTHSFELRYGSMHPLFLLGSLADVVAEATSSPASSRTVSCRPHPFVPLAWDLWQLPLLYLGLWLMW